MVLDQISGTSPLELSFSSQLVPYLNHVIHIYVNINMCVQKSFIVLLS